MIKMKEGEEGVEEQTGSSSYPATREMCSNDRIVPGTGR
jgi:hypothetical protein